MNEFLAQLYGTKEKIAAAQQAEQAPSTEEDELNSAILAEIEKTASAEGVDLNQLSDEDIVGLINEYKVELRAEQEKIASAQGQGQGQGVPDDVQQHVAIGDTIGRTAAHAFYDECNNIQNAASGQDKLASMSDEEIFEALANHRAEAIVKALQGDGEDFVKEASMEVDDEELDDLVTERAAELLDAAGFDVDAIAAALGA